MRQRGQRSRGHTERRTLVPLYATGRLARPAYLVRGSSRRITTMTAGPARSANIRVINRRKSHLDCCLGCLINESDWQAPKGEQGFDS